MRITLSCLIVAVSVFLFSCTLFKTGKYLQLLHPESGDIISEINFPEADDCEQVRKHVIKLEADKVIPKNITCGSATASQSLPYHATIIYRPKNMFIDINTFSLELCLKTIENLTQTNDNYGIHSPCKGK